MVKLLGRRELLAYAFGFTMCAITIFCVVTSQYVEAIVTGFVSMTNAIIGFYFGTRSTEQREETRQ